MKSGKVFLRDGRAPVPQNNRTSSVMSANRPSNTKPELSLRKALWSVGIKGYRLHWKTVPGRPDIAFPGKKKAIFVNGCFWHRCNICKPNTPKSNVEFWTTKFDRNIKRDQEKSDSLKKLGWTVYVVWECEIKNDLKNVVDYIQNIFLKT